MEETDASLFSLTSPTGRGIFWRLNSSPEMGATVHVCRSRSTVACEEGWMEDPAERTDLSPSYPRTHAVVLLRGLKNLSGEEKTNQKRREGRHN